MRRGRRRAAEPLLLGGIAGTVGTMAMTAAMRVCFNLLPDKERYPLPPREITEQILGRDEGAEQLPALSLASHFAYGAIAAALLSASARRPGLAGGAAFGAAVWATSYFGLLPGSNILRLASEHPVRRNLLMLGAHLIWGGVTAASLRELEEARRTIFADGPLRDAPNPQFADRS